MSDQIPPEEDSPLSKEKRRIQKNWFNSLDGKKQGKIIEPAFDDEFPTDADKREAKDNFG
jgi:hypothetical protein